MNDDKKSRPDDESSDIAEEIAGDIGSQLRAVTDQLLEDGFEWPLYVGVVGVNGFVMWLAYSLDESGERVETLLVESAVNEAIAPLNIFIVDARGEAAHARVLAGEAPSLKLLN